MHYENTEAAVIYTATVATISAFSYAVYQLLSAATYGIVV
jgi:hypothetical protein